jgi:predicted RNase H-like nuclease
LIETLTSTLIESWVQETSARESHAGRSVWENLDMVCVVDSEVCYQAMAGSAVIHSKRAWIGLNLRTRLLASNGIILSEPLGTAGNARPDDVLDAPGAAWSTSRIASRLTGRVPAVDGQTTTVNVGIWY